jgi:hypothetical protein
MNKLRLTQTTSNGKNQVINEIKFEISLRKIYIVINLYKNESTTANCTGTRNTHNKV